MALPLTLASAAATATTDARLQAVMQRLEAGEAITLAAIGGSITTGYAAQPPREQGWAALLARSLGPKVKLVNAGVSGTDSAAGVQRLQAQVLDKAPDLVVVEFGVNDQWLDPAVRGSSYEAILRRLLGAKKPPAVVVLGLTQQGNQARDAVDVQLHLAARYGLTALDFGRWMQARVDAGQDRWAAIYDAEPVHPNGSGHQRIAQALGETLRAAARGPAVATPLPEPLFGRAHEFTRMLAGDTLKPYQQRGFERGGEAHPEWTGQLPGWVSTADGAEAHFLVWGREVAVFHAESEHYRNLEAWVDDGPVVTLRGQVPERTGYLGWHYTVVGRDLEPGAHLLHVRVKRDEWAGSGRPASLLAVMSAGIFPPELHPSDFVRAPLSAATGLIPADDPRLRWTGRIGTAPGARLMAWSGSEMRARFTGDRLALRLAPARGGINHFTVEVDGRRHALALRGDGPAEWRLPLKTGTHELRLVKRTEASQAEALFLGLRLAEGGQLLDPPPARALKFEFYGDSITAGACNGDIGEDQYADLSTHDGTRAYGALTAARLGADYVGIAVSGIGITATWDQLLMPQVWNRFAPRLDAAVAPPDPRAPDVVLLNLGQNDHGFPASKGQAIAADFGARYLAFVRQLRARYPQARLVLLMGGMSAPQEQPAIPHAVQRTVQTLRGEGDAKVWSYRFQAFAWAHPRIDVHAQMADELTAFLRAEVLK
ncbi:lysophospholipase L1-like esterase [Pelomonas aquatica]|uniref:Lysophospholipase L1-like esterase n=1 Tax=Pelomonas aquatica TaxID=431058 RepID=A0ABU1Z695_9BURK|nr:GDSL-type esterase/lipase family protein [Pelomonas aquatica]MDR7296150.1 lysophospholipase L1-like esterase [Pelomonas aquatica]